MKHLLLSIILLTITAVLYGQSVTGKVVSGGKEVPFATVLLKGTTNGVAANEKGEFMLTAISAGEHQLEISALGYQKITRKFRLSVDGTHNLGSIELPESTLGLDEIVITGTMKEGYVTESPVKVEVVTSAFIEKTGTTNVVEAISFVNGISEVVGCGVCFTNSISINGMDGPYTSILIDGTPMFGNLAAVYGLNGIPNSIIDRVEIIKGPSSTLYGSEAIAGVINIITKKPSKQPLISIDQMATTHRESFTDISISPSTKNWNGIIGANYGYVNHYEDRNKDGFGDQPALDRLSAMTKWSMKRPGDKRFDISGKFYYEDRRNGVKAFLKDRAYKEVRGSDSLYGESIYTKRYELFGTYELPGKEYFRLDYSMSIHDQDSYYGKANYQAEQQIGYLNLLWNKQLQHHNLTTGFTQRVQFYDDNTQATFKEGENAAQRQYIPGIFAQDEWQLHEKFTLLGGMRLDYYSSHGLIPAPRLNVKYTPAKQTAIRLNFGSGFRIVNLFTEDHAFVSGNRTVEITEELKPERSWNGAVNFNQVFTIGKSQGMIDVDGFYTYFTNAIHPDYTTPGKIIYGNSNGHTVNAGGGFSISHEFLFPLSYNIGMTFQRSAQTSTDANGNTVTTAIPFSAPWSGVASVSYRWRKAGMTFNYTMTIKGPMQLPKVYDVDGEGNLLTTPRAERSPVFSIHNIRISKVLPLNFELYAGVQNIFNYVQKESPLAGYNDPKHAPGFSPHFDTSYAYAMQHAREFYFGLKWQLQHVKKK